MNAFTYMFKIKRPVLLRFAGKYVDGLHLRQSKMCVLFFLKVEQGNL